MRFVGGIFGIICGFLIIKYRERIGEMIGDPEWASKVGGIYNVLIIVGIFIFLWSLTTMTGTSDFLFSPILSLVGLGSKQAAPTGF